MAAVNHQLVEEFLNAQPTHQATEDQIKEVLAGKNWKKVVDAMLNNGKLVFDSTTNMYSIGVVPLTTTRIAHAPARAFTPIVSWTKRYNFYEYAHEYLVLKTMAWKGVSRAVANAEVLSYENVCNVDYDISAGLSDIQALYKELATTLQTGGRMPNVIQFLNPARLPVFRSKLCGFNPSAVLASYSNWRELLDGLVSAFGVSPTETWENYAQGLYTGAELLSSFANKTALDTFIKSFPTNPSNPKGYDYPEYAGQAKNGAPYRVFGMAYVLACNYLKECGHVSYIKPDTHVLAVCAAIGLCPVGSASACQSACRAQAAKAGVTPYALDKVLWLCCSGQFYRTSLAKFGGGASKLKPAFIRELLAAIAAGYLVL
ncbi:MAG: hypothetical protein J5713_04030 [Clostridia bacterium]|nr:hypothetical protein [Clostridia bacterium]